MKKIFLSIILLGFAFYTVNAQQSTDEVYNGPEIAFDKVVHDYGKITYGGNGRCEFKFTNTGKEPLILSNVISSCGCTVPEWPRQPILPNQSSVIKVKYDSKRQGIISKQITVLSNAKTNRIILKIKGQVMQKPKANIPVKKNVSPANKS